MIKSGPDLVCSIVGGVMKLEGFFERIAGGDVVFIGGRPETGKTTIALKFAEFASKKE